MQDFFSNIVGLVVGVALLTAWYGFGSFVLRCARLKKQFSPGLSAAVGMSAFVLLGGVLDLMSLVTRPIISVLIVVGVGVAVREARREKPDAIFTSNIAYTILGVLLAGWFVCHAATISFYSDDFNGYLFFFEKFAQTGTLGVDPFSGKRLYSGLGGYFFVQATLRQFGSIAQMDLFDAGLCTVISGCMIAEYLAARRVSPWVCFAAASLVLTIDFIVPTTNTASGSLRTGLLALMLLVAEDDADTSPYGRAFVMAILAGACISLKGTMLVAVPALMGGLFLVEAAARPASWMGLAARYAVAGALAILLNVPYMLSLRESSGTFLSLLGSGFSSEEFNALALVPAHTAAQDVVLNLLRSRRMISAVILLIAMLVILRARPFRSRQLLISAAALPLLMLASIAIGYSLARLGFLVTRDMERYAAPILGAGFLFSAAAVVCTDALVRSRMSAVIATLTLALAVQATSRDAFNHARQIAVNLVYLATGNVETAGILMRRIGGDIDDTIAGDEARKRRLHAVQQTALPGTTIMVMVGRPYLLDFARNRIFLNECIGAVSPPPGLPLTEGAGPVAEYLRNVGVRYIMFEYSGGERADENAAARRVGRQTPQQFLAQFPETTSRYDAVCDLKGTYLHSVLAEWARTNGKMFEGGLLLIDLKT